MNLSEQIAKLEEELEDFRSGKIYEELKSDNDAYHNATEELDNEIDSLYKEIDDLEDKVQEAERKMSEFKDILTNSFSDFISECSIAL